MNKRLKQAPISIAERTQLRTDANDIRAAAKRKQVTLDRFEDARESTFAKTHFELGAWLFYYRNRISATGAQGLQDRIDCARRIYEAGLINPEYDFFTVFDFGERQYDTIFESGDADAVLDGLRFILNSAPTEGLRKAFLSYGWPTELKHAAPQCPLFSALEA
ncbi:hypothetical protein [Noviherbaspirillum malthae]|uniref:hypothetical protein n=1 Tax=Noviherbaspirillum malthae TaxID=1260987 RepID=UPI0018903C2D|nr:hypothetical protein [Noviherbaspirillum malthae]